MEHLAVKTKANPSPKYDFGKEYDKFPCYLRRAAIHDALGKVSSYRSNLANGQDAAPPKAGDSYPAIPVKRGRYIQDGEGQYHYGICTFATGKQYSCDLSASYHICARYFIRELLKSLPETVRSDMEAKVPSCTKRSTCTLSTLIRLNAGLVT